MEPANLQSYTFEVVVGTYEEFVIGYVFKEDSKVSVIQNDDVSCQFPLI